MRNNTMEQTVRLPAVLHIGFPKCASTFLQGFLAAHSEVYLRFKTEYFAPLSEETFAADPLVYARYFEAAQSNAVIVESDEHILQPIVHPTIGVRALTMNALREVLSRIGAVVPEARLLIVMRNQQDMLLSSYSEYILGRGTFTCDEYIREFLQCSKDGENYFQNFYAEVLQAVEQRFPGRNLVILQEDLQRDPDASLGKIARFLGISATTYAPSFKTRRVGLSPVMLRFLRCANRLFVRRKDGRYREQLRVPEAVYRLFCNLLRILDYYAVNRLAKKSRHTLISTQTRELIFRTFSEDNRKLAQLLDRPVREVGYGHE